MLTQYQGIEDIDVAYELARERKRGEVSPIESIIEDAVKTASNYLVPEGIEPQRWKRLSPEEKRYLTGCLEPTPRRRLADHRAHRRAVDPWQRVRSRFGSTSMPSTGMRRRTTACDTG